MTQEQGVQAQERVQELASTQSTFRIVSIDGGKTLNAELPIPRLVGMVYVRTGVITVYIFPHTCR
jgi:hypothetical protein